MLINWDLSIPDVKQYKTTKPAAEKSTATGSFIYAVIPPSKGYGKLASLAVNGGCGDFSAVERRYLADERETQAESAFAAAGFVRAVESAPYLRQILFFYPDSVILHREHDAAVLLSLTSMCPPSLPYLTAFESRFSSISDISCACAGIIILSSMSAVSVMFFAGTKSAHVF